MCLILTWTTLRAFRPCLAGSLDRSIGKGLRAELGLFRLSLGCHSHAALMHKALLHNVNDLTRMRTGLNGWEFSARSIFGFRISTLSLATAICGVSERREKGKPSLGVLDFFTRNPGPGDTRDGGLQPASADQGFACNRPRLTALRIPTGIKKKPINADRKGEYWLGCSRHIST